ncbi:MAG: hypothetical protein AAF703_24430 [Cyanobacteria bacterium P01_D01_bin.105]
MSLTSIRRGFGFGWFCLLSMLTAGVVVSMDYEIGSLHSALTTYLSSTVVVAVFIALMAVWPLIVFKRRQWTHGLLAAFSMGVVSHLVLHMLITSSARPSIQESLLFVIVAGACWILIALPSALFLSRS